MIDSPVTPDTCGDRAHYLLEQSFREFFATGIVYKSACIYTPKLSFDGGYWNNKLHSKVGQRNNTSQL